MGNAKAMSQILNLCSPTLIQSLPNSSSSSRARFSSTSSHQSCVSLQHKLKCNGRVSCLFQDNRREEQARKALESALGGKKNEFEKWNKEIKKREQVAGGGDTGGGGGWFGWGRRFGWSNGDNFWQEAQQACLAILGIIVMYLIIAKGQVMFAIIINPLLFALRGTRNGLTFITSKIMRKISPDSQIGLNIMAKNEVIRPISAKEEVMRKWRS